MHLDEGRDGMGDVGQQDVLACLAREVAGGDGVEDHEHDDEQDGDTAPHAPGREVASQNRNRFSPPSTTSVCPVT